MGLIRLSQYKPREAIIIISFLLLVLFSLCAHAEGQDIWQVRDVTLTNGLRVLLLEDHRNPTVTLQVWYRVGSRNEHLGTTGISHMLEHMMFRGARKYGPGAFSEMVEKNGGNDNAFTTEDYTVYFENIASQKVDILLDLESDRMADILLDTKLFLLEKNVVIEERRLRTEDNPVPDLLEQVDAAAFKAHPYHSPVIGWMSDIEQLTRDDVYNYYKTYYAPNNAVLVVVGDFKSEELIAKIERSFGPIKSNAPPTKVRSIEPPQRGERRVTLRRNAELPFVAVAYHTPNFTSHDSFALEVLSTILAKGDSSRLYKSLVYDKQIALSIGGDYSRLNIDPSLIYFYAQVLPGRSPADVENAIYGEIEKIKREPISQYELDKAKNQLESSFVFSQDSLFGRGFILGQYEILGNWKRIKDYIPGIRAVTAEDVMNIAKKYLTQDNRTVGVLILEKPQS
jgi:zinc protease